MKLAIGVRTDQTVPERWKADLWNRSAGGEWCFGGEQNSGVRAFGLN